MRPVWASEVTSHPGPVCAGMASAHAAPGPPVPATWFRKTLTSLRPGLQVVNEDVECTHAAQAQRTNTKSESVFLSKN